jgi:hypothetical protein
MKRIVKIVAAVVVLAIALLLTCKQEIFLQTHYDTAEIRGVKKTSLLGIELFESVAWARGGWRGEYREIFGRDPLAQRWRSSSKRPIVSSHLFNEYHWSVMSWPAVILRDRLTSNIFERYEKDRSVERAIEAFADLESLLPSNESLEKLDYDDVRRVCQSAMRIPSLQELIHKSYIPGGFPIE